MVKFVKRDDMILALVRKYVARLKVCSDQQLEELLTYKKPDKPQERYVPSWLKK